MSSYWLFSTTLILILTISVHASPPYEHHFAGPSSDGIPAPAQTSAYGPSLRQELQQPQDGPIIQQSQYRAFAPPDQQPKYGGASPADYRLQQPQSGGLQYSDVAVSQQQYQFVPVPQQYDVASPVKAQPQLQLQPQVLSNTVVPSGQQPTTGEAQQSAAPAGVPVAPLPTNGWFGAAQMAPPPVPTKPPPLVEPYYTFAEGTMPGICAYGFPPPTYSVPSKKCVPYHPACGLFFTCILDV